MLTTTVLNLTSALTLWEDNGVIEVDNKQVDVLDGDPGDAFCVVVLQEQAFEYVTV